MWTFLLIAYWTQLETSLHQVFVGNGILIEGALDSSGNLLIATGIVPNSDLVFADWSAE